MSEVTVMPGNTTAVLEDQASYPLVSNELRQILESVFYVALNGILGVLGSIANVINLVVFIKQGFKDSVNISLFGLAVSDLGSLLFIIWESICLNPLIFNSDSSFSVVDIHYLTSAVPHGIFVRIAWWITAFITFERCLCIAVPLKVKQIITPKRTIYVIIVIFIFTFLGMSPFMIANRIGPTFSPILNRTIYARIFNDNGLFVENFALMFNVASQFGAFIVDVLSTIVIAHLLTVKSKWRAEAASAKEGLSFRDKKVVKMVVLISAIFICCLLPSCLNFFLGVVLAPDYTLRGVQQNLFLVVWSAVLTLEAINSSVTIFVYYNMSSKYKAVLHKLIFDKTMKQTGEI
ncbi:cysteinyl leukotriene receptor 1 [Biomphalaria glabrata]|nr:cysteinyl leukotriene receptor 1-like; partial [Biomphalaria glabrata]